MFKSCLIKIEWNIKGMYCTLFQIAIEQMWSITRAYIMKLRVHSGSLTWLWKTEALAHFIGSFTALKKGDFC